MMTRHDRGAFVPRVDFVCGAGYLDGGTSRTDRGLPEGGPKLVVTPLGVFDFEPATRRCASSRCMTGVTLERGPADNTGFELVVPDTWSATVTPSRRRRTVRAARLVDFTGVLARKFPWPQSQNATDAKVVR